MAVYRFALEPLLGHRKFMEERLQKELAALERRYLEEQEELRRLGREREALLAALELKQRESATVSELLLYMTFIERVWIDLEKKSEEVAAVEAAIGAARSDLIEAIKKRKILDRLKEKGLEAFIQQENSQEQKFVNEVAIRHYLSRR